MNAIQFNSWIKASVSAIQGSRRAHMEDRILLKQFFHDNQMFFIALCADGHGGDEVAQFIVDNMITILTEKITQHGSAQMRRVLNDTFLELHERVKPFPSGSTLSVILIVEEPLQVWLANVGDSSIYGVANNKVVKISQDHTLNMPSERKRITHLPGFKIEDGYVMAESGHGINMTRSLGDHEFTQALLPTPYIRNIKKQYDVIIMGTDGLFDVVSAAKILNCLTEVPGWEQSASHINFWRNEQYSQHDNTSLILLYFDWAAMASSSFEAHRVSQ